MGIMSENSIFLHLLRILIKFNTFKVHLQWEHRRDCVFNADYYISRINYNQHLVEWHIRFKNYTLYILTVHIAQNILKI